jgi:hypothetical protein
MVASQHRLTMRIAFVQGGPGLEAVEKQAARLRRLAPDRYQIEAHPTGSSRQRLVELLDGLRPGDELCLASLESLLLEPGDTAQAMLRLLDRGANLLLSEENQTELNVAESPGARRVLEALAAVHRHRREAAAPKAPPSTQALLTDAEIEDIRRLGAAGLSPRRIGLIYRRSPKCISDVLGAASDPAGEAARRRA